MNILFLLRGNGIGGVEFVTQTLANKFVREGNFVSIFIFRKEEGASFVDRLDKRINLYQHDKYSANKETVALLRKFIVENNIQIIINQWGLPLIPIRAVKKATKGLKVKIISVYHNAPNENGRIRFLSDKIETSKIWITKIVLKIIRSLIAFVTSKSMSYNYWKSDKFLVLSDSYIKVFQKFTDLNDTAKLGVMTNPVTLDADDLNYANETLKKKEKEIIYVGRLDNLQKKVYRVIETWKQLEPKHPDWKLTIIGEGVAKNDLISRIQSYHLEHVSLVGFQNPLKYYKRASILILTSDFEGFPLVLAEAMSFGVVPVVYDSFAAVRDIIENGKDGIIVSPKMNVFSAVEMANGIEEVMKDYGGKKIMAEFAIKKSKNYSIDVIYQRWIKFFIEQLGIS